MQETSNCSQLQEVNDAAHPLYVLQQALQLCFCILSPCITLFSTRHNLRVVYLNPNLKTLTTYYVVAVLAYCISFGLIELYHLGSRFFLIGCELLVPVNKCIYFRIVQSWASVVCSMFYIAVPVDILLTHLFNIFNTTRWPSRVIGLFVYVLAAQFTYKSFLADLQSDEFLVNCATFGNKSKAHILGIMLGFLILDSIAVALFALLHIYIGIRQSFSKSNYDLNATIERREIGRAIHLLLPNVGLHLCCYFWYAGTSIFALDHVELWKNPQVGYMLTNSLPFYMFASPCAWAFVLHRQKCKVQVTAQVDERNLYFKALQAQWDNVSPASKSILK